MDAGTLHFLINRAPDIALALVFLWAMAAGKLHSDPEYDQLRKDYEAERAAHEITRQALAIASARADAGIKAAELVAASLEGARHAQAQAQIPPP